MLLSEFTSKTSICQQNEHSVDNERPSKTHTHNVTRIWPQWPWC